MNSYEKKQKLGENYCEAMSVPMPKPEMSDRLKTLITQLALTEDILNCTLWNVCLEKYERDENIKEPECHMQSIDVLENHVYWLQRIAEKLNNELK